MSQSIFDLEQQMLQFANVTEDIDLVTKHFIDSPDWGSSHFSPQACDAMMNKYFAIKELYELKFDEMWQTFETVCKEYHEAQRKASAVRSND